MTKHAVWLPLLGACSLSFSELDQQVADPAPTLSITSAGFHDAIGGINVTYCGEPGGTACVLSPPVQVRWGTPADGTNKSGLGFTPGAPHVIVYDASFTIGALTHFNFPTISGTWSSGVSLDLGVRVDPSILGSPLFDQTITIPFTMHETPNVEPCPYPSTAPCSDKVTFGTSTFQLVSTSDSTVYELEILGFVDPSSPTPIDGLISEEGGSTSAVLQAVVRQHCVDADSDGACDETDNCLGTPNPDQADSDGDGRGDACDVCPLDAANDIDGDGFCGNVDTCPTVPNPDQSTLVCTCPCDAAWKNHGEYVSCVAHATTEMVRQGQMSHQERSVIVATAGQSSCGR